MQSFTIILTRKHVEYIKKEKVLIQITKNFYIFILKCPKVRDSSCVEHAGAHPSGYWRISIYTGTNSKTLIVYLRGVCKDLEFVKEHMTTYESALCYYINLSGKIR